MIRGSRLSIPVKEEKRERLWCVRERERERRRGRKERT